MTEDQYNRALTRDEELLPLAEDNISAKIRNARQEYREGKTISLKTHEDVDRYFESM